MESKKLHVSQYSEKKKWNSPKLLNLSSKKTFGGVIVGMNESVTFPTVGGGTVKGADS